jgi:hypothetical protein
MSAMGFGVGTGVGVGRAVALGAIDGLSAGETASADGEEVETRPGIASHATHRTSSRAARALIVLG